MLLRAGIGPAAELRARGVAVAHDLPGVGRNLQEHPAVSMSAVLRRGARMGEVPRRHVQMALRYSSGDPEAPPNDMFLVVVAKSAWHPIGRRIGSLFAWINKPFSQGSVTLDPSSPMQRTEIRFELLSDPRDLRRLVAAYRTMAGFLAAPALARVTTDPFASTHGAMAALVGRITARNWLLTIGPALLLDGPGALRRGVVRALLGPGGDLSRALDDDDRLAAVVKRHMIGGFHASGTCRMGAREDPLAVVDPATARVHGMAGLSVVDASVMPSVPRANTNIPTIMLAEKFADAILARRNLGGH
jgi:5-(hydroxymethyl)furfural/furfural oxidase